MNKFVDKRQIKKSFKFLTMLFSVLLIVGGFTLFIDATSAAKLNRDKISTLIYNRISDNIASQQNNTSEDGLWQKIDRNSVKNLTAAVSIKSSKSHVVELNKDLLTTILSKAPLENTPLATSNAEIITLPMPDGSFARFKIVESPIMESQLAAEFPEIKTYSGHNLDDPNSYVKFDITPFGFHGMIRSANGLILIDPYTANNAANNTNSYISYFRKDVSNIKQNAQCLVKGEDIDSNDFNDVANSLRNNPKDQDNEPFNLSSGPILRTYRLAVSATGEFTNTLGGGTVAGAMSKIVTIINRVNSVYEVDLGIRMTLVNNNSNLIFTDP